MTSRNVLTAMCTCFLLGNLAYTASAQAKPPVALKAPPALKLQVQPAFRDSGLFKGKLSADVASGEKLLLQGKYKDAQDTFWKAINRNSKDQFALCGMGYALAMQFKLDGADDNFSKALKINGRNPEALTGRAFVRLYRLQSSNMTVLKQKQSMLAASEADCQAALRVDAKMAEALVVLGMVQKEQGRYQEAIASLSRGLDIDPKYGAAYVKRGMILFDQGNIAAAESDFKQAIALKSSNSAAHLGLGKVLLSQGNVEAAIKELNTALYLNTNSAPVHITLGDAYAKQGNFNAAISEYKKAIEIKAESSEAYIQLSKIREGRGDLELALAELRGGLELNPNNLELHRRTGDIALRLEKTDDAIKEYTAAINLYPGDADSVKGMTRAYVLKAQKEAQGAFFMSNNYEAAERMIQQAIQMNPNDLELRLADAKFRAMSGKPVDLASIPQPTNDATRIAYAEALLAQFKFDEAAQQMATVLNNTNDPAQVVSLADMSLLIRDLDSAEAAYNKAQAMPDVSARAKIGLRNTQNARDTAKQSLTFANDLARKKQLASAIDKYRNAAYLNPRLAEAHQGLAEALEKFYPKDPASLREAVLHLRAYLALDKTLPEKQQEKLSKHIEKLEERAYKIERKQQQQGR